MNKTQVIPQTTADNVFFPGSASSLMDVLDANGGIPVLTSDGKIQTKNLPTGITPTTVVQITDTAVTINMQANTVYICSNPVSSLTITGIPNSIGGSVVVFVPNYGSAAQQDLLCPITMPQGVSLLHFDQNEYKYNKQAIICVQYGIPVFGQQ